MTHDEASLIVRLYGALQEEGLLRDHYSHRPEDETVLRDAWNMTSGTNPGHAQYFEGDDQ